MKVLESFKVRRHEGIEAREAREGGGKHSTVGSIGSRSKVGESRDREAGLLGGRFLG